MSIKKQVFEQYIKNFRFKELFNDLGWDYVVKQHPLAVDDEVFQLEAVAEKRGFVVFVCPPQRNGKIPDNSGRKKIDHAITKRFFEHLLIFTDRDQSKQVWQLSRREPNKPIVFRETTYYTHQTPELLFQKLRGLFFTIDEEENINLVDVKQRVSEHFNANAEKVTKQFYDKFKKEHTAFLKFIEGITEIVDRDWYASLMLNRLMFIYFIQKKGFLDNNRNYLGDKIKETQVKKGKNRFYSFYRDFLLVLFHEGLGTPERNPELLKEIGRVPYLNGGLFDVHRLEASYKQVNIADEAFERVFEFFDQYEWHLDTRVTATGRDINPDVIGYIFEKYINDRAAMGAYYTKEDITEYISKNTILPFLFEETKEECANAFREDSSLWEMLQENPDRYIYEAVRKGTALELPENIAKGIHNVAERKGWNTCAPPEYALPTEIWREVVERRIRYFDLRANIENGDIRDINDFITYNLDIRQFAQDAVAQYEGSDFINAFYKALSKITVLDPTCGSGAFLFAALNILEPLYEACIERMRSFAEEDDQKGGKRFTHFRKVLQDIERHPNLQYYIYKAIILNNLYGVDIMNEAVEIAKLRLFLKLVTTVEVDYRKPNLGLEPLPDIDFNIRAGNTLIGFATKEELDEGLTFDSFDFDNTKETIHEQMEIVARTFKRFKDLQLGSNGQQYQSFKTAKDELETRLQDLDEKLNYSLVQQYGKNPDNKPKEYQTWKQTHQPFHWFAEFYGIIHEHGGFDVIIGNPPYVNLSFLKNYTVKNFVTLKTRNLYSLILERCQLLASVDGRQGYIVPVSSIATEGYSTLQKILIKHKLFISSYDDRPSHLFNDLDKNTLSILLLSDEVDKLTTYSTRLCRWSADERNHLFSLLEYENTPEARLKGCIPKIGCSIEASIWKKIFEENMQLAMFYDKTSDQITYYSRKINAFLQVLDFIPEVRDGNGELRSPSEFKKLNFLSFDEALAVFCCFNSTLFRWFMDVVSDGSHLNRREVDNFPFDPTQAITKFPKLKELAKQLSDKLKTTSKSRVMRYKHDTLTVQCIIPKYSKSIIDEVDKVLAEHYDFTDEELDFIINYDIKYRMGKELEGN